MGTEKKNMISALVVALQVIAALYLIVVAGVTFFQRSLLYAPGHDTMPTELTEWRIDGIVIGYAHEVKSPKNVWLMLHGNAGQAAGRGYVLPYLSADDSLYVLEYPGFGARSGNYSQSSINAAALIAYQNLRSRFPSTPVCILGESLGSGPSCYLGTLPTPPDKIVLVVPYDTLTSTAAEHYPWIPVGLLMFDRWNNIECLKQYHGKVEIFGAADDRVIPVRHARNLASQVPGAVFHELPGGHDWTSSGMVKLRN